MELACKLPQRAVLLPDPDGGVWAGRRAEFLDDQDEVVEFDRMEWLELRFL